MFETIQKIGNAFRLRGELNMTYRVTYRRDDGTTKAYIFQRINTTVFHNPVEIMHNIDLVTSYIREKFPNERTLHFHHTEDGANYVFDDQKCFWRVMNGPYRLSLNGTARLV